MAKKKFEVLVLSYIGNKLVQPGEIVEIETDVEKGGMNPGSNLQEYKPAKE